MKIAIYQCAGVPGSKDGNLKLLHNVALSAAEQGAQLLICPEMFLSGYNIGDAVFELAEPVNGPAFQSATVIAREAGIAMLYGYPERDEDRVYNSAILIDRNGVNLANYRKTHLYGPEENRLFQKGNEWVITELEGVKLGILICYDVEFPEAVRTLALAGASLVAVPTAIMQPFCRTCHLLVPARAYENQIFVAYANRCGQENELIYCGLSCIVGPDGKDRLRAGVDEELRVAEIDVSDIDISRQVNPYLTDLRPELYTPPHD
ncbi:MAG: carbon-nitrogen hydrolase family protein [Deltaproteobacteria bacterium]|nr:carbon-nitrogen hydrolase family protein [Deltaproteobacteria bacterium]